jgi:hypothetical protein
MQPDPPKYICPYCDSDLKYVPQFEQYWCEKCHIYPYEKSVAKKAVDEIDDIFYRIEDELGTKSCDHCGIRMTYVKQFKQWWCPNCRRYTSLPQPPSPPLAAEVKKEKKDSEKSDK